MKFACELSQETLICTELKVKDYKVLLKTMYGEDPHKIILLETICDLLSSCTNKSADYFKNLNLLDLFCLILEIRINSHGDECKIHFKQDEKTNIDLRLDYVKSELILLNKQITNVASFEGIDIEFACPSLNRLSDPIEDEYLYFIKSVFVNQNNTKHLLKIDTNQQSRMLFDSVSPKTGLQIINHFEKIVDLITTTNFLERYGFFDQKLTFVPSIDNFIWFVKLIFNEGLDHFYDNIFHLSHLGHMDANYVESCAVGEYNYFIGCLRRALSKQNSSDSDEFETDPAEESDGLSEEPI